MIGDDGIGNPWQAVITLNAVADKEYSHYIVALCKRLFAIEPTVWKRKTRNALVHALTSTTIVDFLVEEGLIRGDKLKGNLKIPLWILSTKEYKVSCMRGLVDTDGCLYIHHHRVGGKMYQNIGLNFSSHSPSLIAQFASVFEEFDFMPHINKQGNEVFLYRESEITRYLEVFGTSNDRILSVYRKYMDEKYGGVG